MPKEEIEIAFGTLRVGKRKLGAEGHVLKKGTSIRNFDIKLLFQAADGTFYTLPTQLVHRKDITAYFNDGNNYDASGFRVTGLSPRLFAKGPFKIFLLYRNDGKNLLIDTGEVR